MYGFLNQIRDLIEKHIPFLMLEDIGRSKELATTLVKPLKTLLEKWISEMCKECRPHYQPREEEIKRLYDLLEFGQENEGQYPYDLNMTVQTISLVIDIFEQGNPCVDFKEEEDNEVQRSDSRK